MRRTHLIYGGTVFRCPTDNSLGFYNGSNNASEKVTDVTETLESWNINWNMVAEEVPEILADERRREKRTKTKAWNRLGYSTFRLCSPFHPELKWIVRFYVLKLTV